MKLNDGKVGQSYRVCSIDLPQATSQRLLALGMCIDTSVEVLHKKKSGTCVIDLRGTRFALGKDIASKIEVADED